MAQGLHSNEPLTCPRILILSPDDLPVQQAHAPVKLDNPLNLVCALRQIWTISFWHSFITSLLDTLGP